MCRKLELRVAEIRKQAEQEQKEVDTTKDDTEDKADE